MKKLGSRNYAVILPSIKSEGTYNPDEIFFWFEEQLFVDEADTIREFLEWVHLNKKYFGHGNYEDRFTEFLKQNNQVKVC